MTSSDCPACHSDSVAGQWLAPKLGPGARVAWCGACGFGWQDPLPTRERIRHYYETYPPYNIHGAGEKEEHHRLRVNRLNGLRTTRGTLLDVGSGLGHFLKLASSTGWRVSGIETQSSAARYCRDELGIEVYQQPLEQLELAAGSFDVVTVWDVWEHVHDPIVFLDRCLALLKPNGLIAIGIPNASGLPARLFRGYWRYVILTHLSYFTHQYAIDTLAQRGYRVVRAYHTIKAHSLIEGTFAKLGLGVDHERIFRMGRTEASTGSGGDGQTGSAPGPLSRFRRSTLSALRRLVLAGNRTLLPIPAGDVMDFYAEATS